MIIAKTKLKKIPDKCNSCKFCEYTGQIGRKSVKECGYLGEAYRQKKCFLTGVEVPFVYNVAKRNWEYTKCKSCPLLEVEEND